LKLPSVSAALASGAGPICRRWAVINLWRLGMGRRVAAFNLPPRVGQLFGIGF
jgi:hypothetical protein